MLERSLKYLWIDTEGNIHSEYATKIDFCFDLWAHNSKWVPP